VYTHRTGQDSGKIPEPSRQNVSPQKAAPPAAAVKSSQPSPAVPRSVTTLISAAGLPADKLSASIVSFARFFSLPFKPQLLASIRRQSPLPTTQASMAQSKTASPMASPMAQQPTLLTQVAELAETVSSRTAISETLAKNREALSLAAAAAKDKGVELSPEKIETYTEAIDPDWQKRNSGRNSQEQQHKEQKKEDDDKAEIKKMALESAEKDPLLTILNRLPGRNGQFWLVLPFDYSESGREFKVSLRILIDDENAAENGVKHMALDIAEQGEQKQRWLFVPVHRNSDASGIDEGIFSRLMLFVQPELTPIALESLARKIAKNMEIPLENISVINMTESFPAESNGGDDLLCTVNEAV
jgi:hypothetical protein